MKLFRAVPRINEPSADTTHTKHTSLRAPSNVPYLVDNLWEHLRPSHMPSRRHAAYASPTPELALANASAIVGDEKNAYAVFEVSIKGQAKVAHLNVTDARYHDDIRQLPKAILNVLGEDFSALPLAERMAVAPLFMPYMKKEDILVLAASQPVVQACLDKALSVSTFWKSARTTPCATSTGELFFELADDAAYHLVAIAEKTAAPSRCP